MINSGGSSSTEESTEMKGGRVSTVTDQVTQHLQDRRPWRVGHVLSTPGMMHDEEGNTINNN